MRVPRSIITNNEAIHKYRQNKKSFTGNGLKPLTLLYSLLRKNAPATQASFSGVDTKTPARPGADVIIFIITTEDTTNFV